jgi:hypothetical protein
MLRTQLNHLGVLEDAHVSLFIVAEDTAAVEEDRVLWVGCNVGEALAWIHRSISELDGLSAGRQAI